MIKTCVAIITFLVSLSILIIGCTREREKLENKLAPEKVENKLTAQAVPQTTPQESEKNPASVLIGKWDRVSGTNPERVEFLPDNTMIFGKDVQRSANYRIIDDERVEIKDASEALILNFKVTGDTLLLGNGPDQTTYKILP